MNDSSVYYMYADQYRKHTNIFFIERIKKKRFTSSFECVENNIGNIVWNSPENAYARAPPQTGP